MREVGDRFQNMYFAAKGGNWGLAHYMSKYMNGAMNPAKVTKPDEYPLWSGFYESWIDPGIKVSRLKAPADPGLDYTLSSKGEDVPK